jgi:hypothetical protein
MSKFKKLDKKVKKMDLHDIQLTKLSTTAFILFLIVIWPGFLELVLKIHWGWYLGIGILAAIRPIQRFFS